MTTPVRRGRTLRARLLDYITKGVARIRTAWKILTTAQDQLLAALARIAPTQNGISRTLRAAINAFHVAVAEFNRTATAFAESWAATSLPRLYREGAWAFLENGNLARERFRWTPTHQTTITLISAQFYADFTARITEALRRARAFLRDAQQASRTGRINLGQLRRDHPLGTVIYANDARHPVESWAQGAVTWQAVSAANIAAARVSLDDLGVAFVEVRDGPGCGWDTHQSEDKAHRTLRTVQDALAHPAAHPNCQREFLPRLDLAGRTDIRSGTPL